MIYLVEDIDRTGKSTFIDKVCTNDIYNKKISSSHKCLSMNGNITIEANKNIMLGMLDVLNCLFDTSCNYFFDRFFLSEAVYAFLYRKCSLLDCTMLIEYFNAILDKKAKIIYFTPIDLEKSEQLHGMPLQKDLKTFEKFLKVIKLPVINLSYYDVLNFDKTGLLKFIE